MKMCEAVITSVDLVRETGSFFVRMEMDCSIEKTKSCSKLWRLYLDNELERAELAMLMDFCNVDNLYSLEGKKVMLAGIQKKAVLFAKNSDISTDFWAIGNGERFFKLGGKKRILRNSLTWGNGPSKIRDMVTYKNTGEKKVQDFQEDKLWAEKMLEDFDLVFTSARITNVSDFSNESDAFLTVMCKDRRQCLQLSSNQLEQIVPVMSENSGISTKTGLNPLICREVYALADGTDGTIYAIGDIVTDHFWPSARPSYYIHRGKGSLYETGILDERNTIRKAEFTWLEEQFNTTRE